MSKPMKNHGLLPGKNYLLLCEMAKAGLSDEQMAEQFKIKLSTFRRVKKRDVAVRAILEQAKAPPKDEETFQDYLYGHLTNKQREYWDEIMSVWKADKKSAPDRVNSMLAQCSRKNRQALFVHALIRTNFNATRAGRLVCVPYNTYLSWMKQDANFQALMEEMLFHKDNFFEGALIGLVKKGVPAAVLHVAKSRLSNRGYGSTVKFEGNMTHTHEDRLSIEDLDIDIETRKKLLRAAEKKALPSHEDVIEGEILEVKEPKKRRRHLRDD